MFEGVLGTLQMLFRDLKMSNKSSNFLILAWITWLTIDSSDQIPSDLTSEQFEEWFGNFTGLYWLGLRKVHELSQKVFTKMILRVELTFQMQNFVIEFKEFFIDSKYNGYIRYYSNSIGEEGKFFLSKHQFLLENTRMTS